MAKRGQAGVGQAALMSLPTNKHREHTTMKKYIATLVAAVYAVPAHAVPVTIYGSTVKYANEVSKYYDEAPPTFRNKIGSVIVITFDNVPTLTTLYMAWGLLNAQEATQMRGGNLAGLARYTYDTRKGFLAMIQPPEAANVTSERSRRVVVHEMAHLYDFSNGGMRAGPNGAISQNPAFKKVFDADKQAALALWKRSSKQDRDEVDYYSHYLETPKEAFAEAVARILFPPTNEIDRDNFANTLFPRVMVAVKARLAADGIIPEQANKSNFQRRLPE